VAASALNRTIRAGLTVTLALLALPHGASAAPAPVLAADTPTAPAPLATPLPGEPPIRLDEDPLVPCAARPFDPSCPFVERVYDVRLAPGATSFGPDDAITLRAVNPRVARAAGQRPKPSRRARVLAHASGPFEDVCTYSVHNPSVGGSTDRYVWSSAHLVCGSQPGKVLTYGELGSTLQRYQNGGWANLDSDYVKTFASGFSLQNYVSYNCHHQSLYPYRNDSFAYVVISGQGIYVYKQPTVNHTCWP
jgi:hypothetical protein